MLNTKTEWFFIVNPHAGSGKTMSEWLPAERELDILGIPYKTAYTDYKSHAITLANEAAEEGYRKIMAVGGDGSLHEVFNGILKWCDRTGTPPEDFYIGVIPIGSGNDWIKSFNVPHDAREVVNLLYKESFGRQDIVRLESARGRICYMANIGGIGFDSHVCKRVNFQKESGRRNKRIYLNALRHTLFNLDPINIKLIADGQEIFCGECYSVALGNGKYSGSGMRQVPLAVVDDGLLDVTVVPKLSLAKMLKEAPRLFSGTINEAKELICIQCKRLDIVPLDDKSADIVELDGEIEGRLPATISVTGNQINVIKG